MRNSKTTTPIPFETDEETAARWRIEHPAMFTTRAVTRDIRPPSARSRAITEVM